MESSPSPNPIPSASKVSVVVEEKSTQDLDLTKSGTSFRPILQSSADLFKCKLCPVTLESKSSLALHHHQNHNKVNIVIRKFKMKPILEAHFGMGLALELESLPTTDNEDDADPLSQWFMCEHCRRATCNIDMATHHRCNPASDSEGDDDNISDNNFIYSYPEEGLPNPPIEIKIEYADNEEVLDYSQIIPLTPSLLGLPSNISSCRSRNKELTPEEIRAANAARQRIYRALESQEKRLERLRKYKERRRLRAENIGTGTSPENTNPSPGTDPIGQSADSNPEPIQLKKRVASQKRCRESRARKSGETMEEVRRRQRLHLTSFFSKEEISKRRLQGKKLRAKLGKMTKEERVIYRTEEEERRRCSALLRREKYGRMNEAAKTEAQRKIEESNRQLLEWLERRKLRREKFQALAVEPEIMEKRNRRDLTWASKYMEVVEGDKPFQCKECGRSYRQRDGLRKHTIEHRVQKIFVCEVCGKEFIHKSVYEAHVSTHNPTMQICEVCGASVRHLSYHMKIHGGDNQGVPAQNIGNPQVFQCEQCSYNSPYKRNLQKHLAIHSKTKDFLCDQCNFAARTAKTLKVHMRTHSGEKPFKCMLCPYTANQKVQVENHIRRLHTG